MADINKLTDKIDKLTESIGKLINEIGGDATSKNKKGTSNGGNSSDDVADNEGGINGFKNKLNLINGFMSGTLKAIDGVQRQVADTWGKAEHAATQYAKSVGMSKEAMEKLRENTINFVHDTQLGVKYNTSMEELLKMQAEYANNVGRSIQFTNAQLENMAALKSVIGEEKTIKFTANFERFGLDSDAAIRDVEKMMAGATKKGLSFSKISEQFLNNIDLAQRFTFKNGLDGLRAMAEKAASIKWDMSQTASFADRVNNVEGAVTAGAQLSVLGGPFASLSNPLQLMYESINDLEGLNERMSKMFGSMAHYNKQTRQVEVSAFNRLRIQAAAKAMGADYGKVMESVFAQGRRGEIDRQLGGSTLSDDLKEIVRNKALIDRENGQAYITLNGKKRYVNSLNDTDKSDLEALNRTEAQDIKTTAINTRSIKDILEGTEKDKDALWAKRLDQTGVGERVKKISVHIAKAKNSLSMATVLLTGISSTLTAISTMLGVKGLLGGNGRIGGAPFGGGRPSGGGGLSTGRSVAGSNVGGGTVSSTPHIVGSKNGWHTMSDGTKHHGMAKAREYIRKNTPKTDWAAKRQALLQQKRVNIWNKVGSGAAIGGMVAGVAASAGADHLREQGKERGAAGLDALGYAAQGVAMGSMLGPWGMLAGGLIGAGIGAYKYFEKDSELSRREYNEGQIKRYKEQLAEKGIYLRGEYTPHELSQILHDSRHDSSLKLKMQQQGDSEHIKYANGGLVSGVSHAKGGVTIEAEDGEFIVNKDATSKYFNKIKAINDSTLGGTQIKSNEPMGRQLKVNEIEGRGVHAEVGSVEIKPIDLNFNGTIRLETNGNGKDIDAKELLNNPEFIRNIRDILTKEINQIEHKRFDKSSYWRRW